MEDKSKVIVESIKTFLIAKKMVNNALTGITGDTVLINVLLELIAAGERQREAEINRELEDMYRRSKGE